MQNLKNALGFGGFLGKEEVNDIALQFETRELKAGENFVRIGRISSEIGFINKGIIRSYIVSNEGEEATKYFLRENQFMVDIESYYNNTPSESGLQAVTDCELYIVMRDVWMKMTEKFPKLFILTKSLTEAALLNKIKDNDFLNFGAAERKYKEFITRYPDVALLVPQHYIASYLKITPQSLSRIRKAFVKKIVIKIAVDL